MKGSRRDFLRRVLFGGAILGLFSRAVSSSAETASRSVDRRKLGRVQAEVSILGLGLGAAFLDAFEQRLDAGHALLESALAKGINYWDTGRSYGPSESMIAPVLERNRSRVFLASKSDARDYDGFKRDLDRSLQYSGLTMSIYINCMIWVRTNYLIWAPSKPVQCVPHAKRETRRLSVPSESQDILIAEF